MLMMTTKKPDCGANKEQMERALKERRWPVWANHSSLKTRELTASWLLFHLTAICPTLPISRPQFTRIVSEPETGFEYVHWWLSNVPCGSRVISKAAPDLYRRETCTLSSEIRQKFEVPSTHAETRPPSQSPLAMSFWMLFPLDKYMAPILHVMRGRGGQIIGSNKPGYYGNTYPFPASISNHAPNESERHTKYPRRTRGQRTDMTVYHRRPV